MSNLFKRLYNKIIHAFIPVNIPFKGYNQLRQKIPFVDDLSDQELQELNKLLDWSAFVVDHNGRRFGNQTRRHKRGTPQKIPDRRIQVLNQSFCLADKHIVEAGCFEGIHTVGLCQYAKRVTAFDSRIVNVVKTTVRCSLFSCYPKVFKLDLDGDNVDLSPISADVMFHVGVLYHLKDPVSHLLSLGELIHDGILLDTHYAEESEATESYQVGEQVYRFKKYKEGGYQDVFSGMHDFARWLRLEDLIRILKQTGFAVVDVVEKRVERNGPRVLLIAKRV